MSSLNYSTPTSMQDPHIYFATLLQFGIRYLPYHGLIMDTERFSYISAYVQLTARIDSTEYNEDSPVDCHCPFPFKPKVYWFHGYIVNGTVKVEEIFPLNDIRYSIKTYTKMHSLVIRRASMDTDGAYTCLYEEKSKYKDFTSRIHVKKLPVFDSSNQRFFGSENKSVIISCQVSGAEEATIGISWMRHRTLIRNSNKYNMWHEHDNYYLNISRLTKRDSGWYYCYFREIPKRKKRIVLYIKPFLDVEDFLEVREMHAGESINITCPSEHAGFFGLRKILGPNTETVNSMTLREIGPVVFPIDIITPSDEGLYLCYYHGNYQRITPILALRVLEWNPILLSRDKQIITYYGRSIQLKCESTLRSTQKIIWLKNNFQNVIASGDELSDLYEDQISLSTRETSSILFIKSVKFEDDGLFICQLGNRKTQLNLIVRRVPQISRCSSISMVPVGFEIKIECLHHMSTGLNITWFHNGVKIPSTYEKYNFENGDSSSKLIISNSQVLDSGNYSGCFDVYNNNCFDIDLHHSISVHLMSLVVIDRSNVFTYDNKFEFLTEGNNITMVCQVHNLHPGENLCWQKPDGYMQECIPGNNSLEKYFISSKVLECNLTLIHIRSDFSSRTHSGKYVCRTNCTVDAGEETIIVVYNIRVTSEPKFLYEKKNLTAIKGYDYNIYCNVSHPDGRKIVLMKKDENGSKFLKSEMMPVGKSYQFVYTIPLMRETDTGEYLFHFNISTREGSKLNEMKIYLNIINEPIITITAIGEKLVGKSVTLHCIVSNMNNYKEDFKIDWWKVEHNESHLISSGNALKRNLYYFDLRTTNEVSQLVIKHLFNSDWGCYECRITAYPKFSESLLLNFTKLPIEEKKKIFGIKGKNVELNCKLLDDEKSITWYMKRSDYFYSIDFLIDLGNNQQLPSTYEIFNEGEISKLKISNASELETGVYRCLYPGIRVVDQFVEVVDASIMTVKHSNVKIRLTATLTCNIKIQDEVEAYWIHNGRNLTRSNVRYTLISVKNFQQYSLSLTIYPVYLTDQGMYTCLMKRTNPQLLKHAKLIVLS